MMSEDLGPPIDDVGRGAPTGDAGSSTVQSGISSPVNFGSDLGAKLGGMQGKPGATPQPPGPPSLGPNRISQGGQMTPPMPVFSGGRMMSMGGAFAPPPPSPGMIPRAPHVARDDLVEYER